MEYSIPSAGSGGAYALSLIYPVFTEAEEAVNPYSEGIPQEEGFTQTADSVNRANDAPLTRYSEIENFASLPSAEGSGMSDKAPSDTPVLYAADSDTICYGWTEHSYYNEIRFAKPDSWSGVSAYFFAPVDSNTASIPEWPGIDMTDTGETYPVSGSEKEVYSLKIPKDSNGNDCFTKVIFTGLSSGTRKQTVDIELVSGTYGHGYLYYVTGTNSEDKNEVSYDEQIDHQPPEQITDNRIRFRNTQGWTAPITAAFTVGGSEQCPSEMTPEGEDIYSCIVPEGATAVTFRDDSATPATTSITFGVDDNGGKNMICFTDSDNWRSSSDSGRLYAYYYGGVDGEYTAWPGVAPEGSYTDNSGNTVFYFRPPVDTLNPDSYFYPYVIFNNGSSDSRSITQKAVCQTGMIYTPDSADHVAYGSVTFAASAVSLQSKTAAGYQKQFYEGYSPKDRFIYLVNNGTQNVADLGDSTRFRLDELHVTFYSDEDGTAAVGTSEPGYYADRLEYGHYQGEDVYRIRVPSDAKYFRISNGQGKGSGPQDHYRLARTVPVNTIWHEKYLN